MAASCHAVGQPPAIGDGDELAPVDMWWADVPLYERRDWKDFYRRVRWEKLDVSQVRATVACPPAVQPTTVHTATWPHRHTADEQRVLCVCSGADLRPRCLPLL